MTTDREMRPAPRRGRPAKTLARAAAATTAAIAAAAVVMTFWSGNAFAQQFEKVEEAAKEQIPAVPFVAAAYGFIWVAVLAYVVVVARRFFRLHQEVEDLRRRLGAETSGGAGAVAGRGAPATPRR